MIEDGTRIDELLEVVKLNMNTIVRYELQSIRSRCEQLNNYERSKDARDLLMIIDRLISVCEKISGSVTGLVEVIKSDKQQATKHDPLHDLDLYIDDLLKNIKKDLVTSDDSTWNDN